MCLERVASQALNDDFEVIVVDDASTQEAEVKNTVKESAIDNLTLVRLDESRGPAAARNMGASRATGDLLVFTDDDTLPHERWLERLQAASADADLLEGRVKPTERNASPYKRVVASERGGEFLTANLAVSREVFDEIDGFDTMYRAAFREDTDFGFAAQAAGASARFVDDAVVYHPVYDRSWRDIVVETWKYQYDPLLYSRFPDQYRELMTYPLERYTPAYLLCVVAAIVSPLAGVLLPLVGAAEMRSYGLSGDVLTVVTYSLARVIASFVLLAAVIVGCRRYDVSPVDIFDPREVRRLL
jgi:glycosyltransferase involved in cell wall biosynthesis